MRPTYYDVIKKTNPEVLKSVKKDVFEIRTSGNVSPVSAIDGYKNRFQSYMEQRIKFHIESARQIHYEQYGSKPPYDAFSKEIMKSNDFGRMVNFESILYTTMTNFELFQRKTFYFSNNLVEQLVFTELVADSDYARPPFDSCLFVYDSPLVIESLYRVAGHSEPRDCSFPLSVFVTSLPVVEEKEGKRKLEFRCYHADYDNAYMFIERNLQIRDGWTVDKALKTHWGDVYGEPEHFFADNKDEDMFYSNESVQFFRILMNSILYLASSEPDVIQRLSPNKQMATPSKRLNLKKSILETKRSEHISSLDYAIVGSNCGDIIVDKSKSGESAGGVSSIKTKLGIRFIVRGHWRNQPYGPGLSLKRLVWIRPYYKGPDMAGLINKPYTVR